MNETTVTTPNELEMRPGRVAPDLSSRARARTRTS
jgi:hypothetical protein